MYASFHAFFVYDYIYYPSSKQFSGVFYACGIYSRLGVLFSGSENVYGDMAILIGRPSSEFQVPSFHILYSVGGKSSGVEFRGFSPFNLLVLPILSP